MRPHLRQFRPFAVLLATASIGLAGCASHSPTIESNGTSSATTVAISPALDHVHGAVVVDGRLMVGTHSGLFEVDPASGESQRRGSTAHDLMGLAATGATLFASGHPGGDTSLPDPLGLLRSDDGGVSWTPVSLTGEVDFHGLAARGQQVAGIGTRDGVLVSLDAGATWQRVDLPNPRSLAWLDDGLWIVTDEGTSIWREGALETASTSGRPAVIASTSDATALWAVHEDGSVWRTTDGLDWQRIGSVSALEALAVTASQAYAVTATGIAIVAAG